jgi:protein associated with RNAse G/E
VSLWIELTVPFVQNQNQALVDCDTDLQIKITTNEKNNTLIIEVRSFNHNKHARLL